MDRTIRRTREDAMQMAQAWAEQRDVTCHLSVMGMTTIKGR